MNPRFNIHANSPAPIAADPAAANANWEWIRDVLSRIGLSVLVVETTQNPQQGGWPQVGGIVGSRLEAAGLGEFDSGRLGERCHWYFYAPTARLAEALKMVKAEVEQLGLLPLVRIGYADSEAGLWRTVHPGLETQA